LLYKASAKVEHQISQEAEELKRYPKEEAEELALIYEARGIPIAEARDVAKHLVANPDKALDTLAREELGLNPDDLGSPIGAALSSFIAFAVGASLPLIPFLLGASNGVMIAAAISGAALFLVGALLSLFSGKNPGSAVCACSPSALSRPLRPTGSGRCSTSPPPDAPINSPKNRCNLPARFSSAFNHRVASVPLA
jgi:VIT1/CCC1 family predicted Fe2+/Mn2+ transporter